MLCICMSGQPQTCAESVERCVDACKKQWKVGVTMDNKFIVSSSPHLSGTVKTKTIMIDVIIGLIPALVASIIIFGPRALLVCAVSIAAAVIAEYICRKVMKRENTIGDFSAVVTGLLLAFNLPSGIPLWMAALGSVIAIVVVKQMFGGIGQNFVNPALAARIILMTSFPTQMTTWPSPVDGTASSTPLAMIASEIRRICLRIWICFWAAEADALVKPVFLPF